jgi:antitoxin component of RelBE/YafQ-DinJ toxin-antitoxin module
MRDRLTLAAQRLEEAGHPDSAADVRAVLAPGGWTLLRAKDTPGKTAAGTNLPLTIDRDLRDALKAKADEFGVTLGAVVADGFRKVLAGEWLPPKLASTPTANKVVLNVRVDDSLRKQIDEVKARLTDEAGYRVTQSSIAIAWLAEDLGVDVATVDTDPVE